MDQLSRSYDNLKLNGCDVSHDIDKVYIITKFNPEPELRLSESDVSCGGEFASNYIWITIFRLFQNLNPSKTYTIWRNIDRTLTLL